MRGARAAATVTIACAFVAFVACGAKPPKRASQAVAVAQLEVVEAGAAAQDASEPSDSITVEAHSSAPCSTGGSRERDPASTDSGSRQGSWTATSVERWRNAIENYVSSVRPGNQTALNNAALPFATYLNAMHNRIHPLFADGFLGALESLPCTHPMNERKLATRVEIVLNNAGQVQKMGIVKTSGLTAFDIAALDSVNRAQPFGPAPPAIVSLDGRVYLHWEFHRDRVSACSIVNSSPFLLNVPAVP